jgi:hypothetical protein
MNIAFLLIGLVVGFALAFLFLKSKSESGLGAANEKGRLLEANISELKNEIRLIVENSEAKMQGEREKAESLDRTLASSKTENENL